MIDLGYSNSCSFGVPEQGHKVYADYIAQKFSAELINQGEPGACNRRIIRSLLRDLTLIPVNNTSVDTDMAPREVKFESVDQIVTDQLTNIESEFYDPKLLLQIYQTL